MILHYKHYCNDLNITFDIELEVDISETEEVYYKIVSVEIADKPATLMMLDRREREILKDDLQNFCKDNIFDDENFEFSKNDSRLDELKGK